MKSIIIIPSRMASKRFPGKPMVNVDGTPMIQRVWQQAINSNVGDFPTEQSENNITATDTTVTFTESYKTQMIKDLDLDLSYKISSPSLMVDSMVVAGK